MDLIVAKANSLDLGNLNVDKQDQVFSSAHLKMKPKKQKIYMPNCLKC